MDNLAYQADLVSFLEGRVRYMQSNQWSYLGEKGDPGLPGPGFPGKYRQQFILICNDDIFI